MAKLRFLLLPFMLLLCGAAWPVLAFAADGDDANAQAGSQDERIAALIEQLGDQSYAVRKRAQEKLAELGVEAYDALTEAQSHADYEIASQARYLVRLIRVDWAQPSDPPQVKQTLKDYETSLEADRLDKIKTLSDLPDGAGLAALCRIARFETSLPISKRAALAVIAGRGTITREAAEAIAAALGHSGRPAAQWLRAFSSPGDSREAALRTWSSLVDAEIKTLDETPEESDARIVTGLLRREIALLDELQRPEEATARLRKIVEIEPGDPASLPDLLQWLTERQTWPLVDELAKRFASRIAESPVLLYALAEARRKQGQPDQADELAQQALDLNAQEPREHLQIAFDLQAKGLIDWAEREYRHVIDMPDPEAFYSFMARLQLAEMLHDQLNELEAAKVLEAAVEVMEANVDVLERAQQLDRPPETIRSRMEYFYACYEEAQGNAQKQAERLDRAYKEDRNDADVLIALYHLKGKPGAPEREKILQAIATSADFYREQISDSPADPIPYNQFAWLIGNTEGDLDEAIRFSQKSLELKPASGGYIDTLAHCYYTKGDYDNAVKSQAEAVRLEPHSGQIRRAFERFQQAQQAARSTPAAP